MTLPSSHEEPLDILPELFRAEFSRMVAVIARQFGLGAIELAEDIVSETFLQAAETWGSEGLPPNPPAWLYSVAKNKIRYAFRRENLFEQKIRPELNAAEYSFDPEIDFSESSIKDHQLQMMFAICSPSIASESQMALALRILCGFSIEEIATAFLTSKETINKRLYRARERLRSEAILLELPPPPDIEFRLSTVLHIIYLLFNEGYYSRTGNRILRQDLCYEAMRLALTLHEFEPTNRPETNALLALMCFHASRFKSRDVDDPEPVLYGEQDERLWDQDLISRGLRFLAQSASGEKMSSYHIEAGIARLHCDKTDSPEKWQEILNLYDALAQRNPSPVVFLNRIYALFRVEGPQKAIQEAEALRLEDSHFYHLLLGELYTSVNRAKSLEHFEKAQRLTTNPAEQAGIRKRMANPGI